MLEEVQGGSQTRPGPAGVVPDVQWALQEIPTHSSPWQGLPGPAPLVSPSASQLAGTRYYPSPVPTQYHTPPRYTLPTHPLTHGPAAMFVPANTRFQGAVGEPRVVEHTLV